MVNFKLTQAIRFLAVCCATFMALPLCSFAQGAERSITLQEVFKLVQTQNPSVLAGEHGVEATRQSMRQTRSALLPQLSAQASQLRSRSMIDKGSEGLRGNLDNSFSSAIVLSMSIVDATNIASYKAAKLETSAARYQQESDVQNVFTQAASLYFLYQRHLSSLRVIESSIALDEVLLNIAVQRREADVATELDLTRAKATLAKDRQSLLGQKTIVNQTRLQLLQIVGLDPDVNIMPLDEQLLAPELADLPAWAEVLETRPEYKAANELLQRNRVAEKAADWRRFPSVAVQGQYGHASELPGDGEGGNMWSLGLTMNVPLWEGGRIGAQKLQARALIRQQEQRIREISDTIHSSYVQAVAAIQQRWEEIPLAREAVKLGEMELKYARERFEASVTDNSDVVYAQQSLTSAQDSLVDAIYRYHLARIDLARVLGQVDTRL